MPIKKLHVLGTGCASCEKLAAMVVDVADELHLEYELQKVSEMDEILKYGVTCTPALVVDGEVKVSGGLPSAESLRAMIS